MLKLNGLLWLVLVSLNLHCLLAQDATQIPVDNQGQSARSFTKEINTAKVKFSISLSPASAAPGEWVTLAVETTIAPGWHICSLSQNGDNLGGLPSEIKFSPRGMEAVDDQFVSSHEPRKLMIGGEIHSQHTGSFTWTRKYKVKKNRLSYSGSGSIQFQVCNDQTCLPPQTVEFKLRSKKQSKLARQTASTQLKKLGAPIVVQLEECKLSRPKVKLSTAGMLATIASGSAAKDQLRRRGQLVLDGQRIDLYLPRARKYQLRNTSKDETRFGNTATYLSVDQNSDGEIHETESFACNRPVRILDKMFHVAEIDPAKQTLTLQQVKTPLSGVVLDRKCPEFEFETLDGQTISNKSLEGKTTILDIWAVT